MLFKFMQRLDDKLNTMQKDVKKLKKKLKSDSDD
jgi:Skp family chaperone for outer membrane proteins